MAKVDLGSKYGLGKIEINDVKKAFELKERFGDEGYRVHIYLKTGAILITALISGYAEAADLARTLQHLISEKK